MDVKELKEILKRIEELYAAGGADTAANDLRAVARLLEGYEDKSVEAFITDTKESLDRLVERESLPAPLGDELVAIHSDRLLAARIDQVAFDAALAKLDESEAGKAEWAAIANRYRNAPTKRTHVYKFKSIRDARTAIRDTFVERREASSKQGIIDRLTKWPKAV
jgi:hypothetical protein